ncbi:MAG: hypothetical protein HOO67_07065 [Candidatus Peribacteraceae bacterium]|nr:hypothetical protein [Candidatus Peribacteraceae bacterium]
MPIDGLLQALEQLGAENAATEAERIDETIECEMAINDIQGPVTRYLGGESLSKGLILRQLFQILDVQFPERFSEVTAKLAFGKLRLSERDIALAFAELRVAPVAVQDAIAQACRAISEGRPNDSLEEWLATIGIPSAE